MPSLRRAGTFESVEHLRGVWPREPRLVKERELVA
jgi:hypothetical protein